MMMMIKLNNDDNDDNDVNYNINNDDLLQARPPRLDSLRRALPRRPLALLLPPLLRGQPPDSQALLPRLQHRGRQIQGGLLNLNSKYSLLLSPLQTKYREGC